MFYDLIDTHSIMSFREASLKAVRLVQSKTHQSNLSRIYEFYRYNKGMESNLPAKLPGSKLQVFVPVLVCPSQAVGFFPSSRPRMPILPKE